MPTSNNFNQAFVAQSSSIVGLMLSKKHVGWHGANLRSFSRSPLIATNPDFPATFNSCFNCRIDFVFIATALQMQTMQALPLLTGFSLLTGFTLSGIVALAIGTIGIGSVTLH